MFATIDVAFRVLRGFLRDRQVGVDGVYGTLAAVAVAEVRSLGVVVSQPGVEVGL
jgi:hypothetical protein